MRRNIHCFTKLYKSAIFYYYCCCCCCQVRYLSSIWDKIRLSEMIYIIYEFPTRTVLMKTHTRTRVKTPYTLHSHTHTHHVHILCFIEIRLCMPHDMKQNKADLFFKVCRILFVYFHPNISLICQTCFL